MVKVIILGDPGVGKTSIANRFVNDRFMSQYKATIGADIFAKELVIGDTEIFMQIWDTAGQERFQSLGPGYFRGADACILVYDTTSAKSFESLGSWCSEFIRNAGLSPQQTTVFPFIVVGNKVDLHGDRRQVNLHEAMKWCDENSMPHYETSARQATNVEMAFSDLAQRTLEAKDVALPLYDLEALEQSRKTADGAADGSTVLLKEAPPIEESSEDIERLDLGCCGYKISLSAD